MPEHHIDLVYQIQRNQYSLDIIINFIKIRIFYCNYFIIVFLGETPIPFMAED